MRKDLSNGRREPGFRKQGPRRGSGDSNESGAGPDRGLKDGSPRHRSASRPGGMNAGKFVPGSILGNGRHKNESATGGGYRPGSIIMRKRQRSNGASASQDGERVPAESAGPSKNA